MFPAIQFVTVLGILAKRSHMIVNKGFLLETPMHTHSFFGLGIEKVISYLFELFYFNFQDNGIR